MTSMGDFVIPIGIGIGAGLAWLGLWILVLRVFGLVTFTRTAEEKARVRERMLALGKRKYVLLFGVLGWGLPVWFGIEVSHVAAHTYQGWGGATLGIGIFLLAGWWWGVRMWNESYRGEVPFPPPWLSQK